MVIGAALQGHVRLLPHVLRMRGLEEARVDLTSTKTSSFAIFLL